VLVVEDEPLIAAEVAAMVAEAGFDVIDPVATVRQALALLERQGCDAAVLDVTLGDESSEPVARALISSGTPFVVATGCAGAKLPEVFRKAALIAKPLRPAVLQAEIRRCLKTDGALP
jgi:DNA-binding response OmpR family regulator